MVETQQVCGDSLQSKLLKKDIDKKDPARGSVIAPYDD